MNSKIMPKVTLFSGNTIVSSGAPEVVGQFAKELISAKGSSGVLLFDDANGCQLDVDLRNGHIPGVHDVQEVPPTKGRGRPKLGVVSREVTLLPVHWQWLSSQPGGASATLRRLVNGARETHSEKDKVRVSQNAAFSFMNAMAGDLPGFEEVTRALFADDRATFLTLTEHWPEQVADYAGKLAGDAFSEETP